MSQLQTSFLQGSLATDLMVGGSFISSFLSSSFSNLTIYICQSYHKIESGLHFLKTWDILRDNNTLIPSVTINLNPTSMTAMQCRSVLDLSSAGQWPEMTLQYCNLLKSTVASFAGCGTWEDTQETDDLWRTEFANTYQTTIFLFSDFWRIVQKYALLLFVQKHPNN